MLTVLNDLHIGAQRTGGTTPLTQWQLRRSIISQVDELVSGVDTDLLVLGDLFDTHMVPFSDWLAAWQIFGTWLAAHPKQHLWLVAGNHDLSKTSTTVGSLQALGAVLADRCSNVTLVLEPTEFEYGYIVPHLANQALFDLALDQVPDMTGVLYLHCNYDNNFAVQADQSLNLSADRAEVFTARGTQIVIAHEHQTKLVGKKIWIPGNQVATSVSDCMGTDQKRLLTVSDAGVLHLHPVCPVDHLLSRQDWRALAETDLPFVRVEGEAGAAEAADVVARISKYRAQSKALVITNAVKIKLDDGLAGQFATSLESVKSFDVMSALKEILTPKEYEIVLRLKQTKGAQQC